MAKDLNAALSPNELSTTFFELIAQKTADGLYEALRVEQELHPEKNRITILNDVLAHSGGMDATEKARISSTFNEIFENTSVSPTPSDTPAIKKEITEGLYNGLFGAFKANSQKIAGTDDQTAPFDENTRQFLTELAKINVHKGLPVINKLESGLTKYLQTKIDTNTEEAEKPDADKALCEKRTQELKHAQEKLAEFRKRRHALPPSQTPQFDNNRKEEGKDEKKTPAQKQEAQQQEENLLKRLAHANGYHENALLMAIIVDWMMLGPTIALELMARTIKHGPSVAILMTLGISELDAQDPGLSKALLEELGVIGQNQTSGQKLGGDTGNEAIAAQKAAEAHAAKRQPHVPG